MAVTAEFELQAADMKVALGSRVRWIQLGLGVLGALALGRALWQPHRGDAYQVVVLAVPGFFLLALAAWSTWGIGRAALRNMTVDERRMRVQLDEEGLRTETQAGGGFHRWGGLHRVTESDRGFGFYVNDRAVIIVPTRALTAEDVSWIRAQVAVRVAPRPQTRWKWGLILWAVLILGAVAGQLLFAGG